MSTSSKNYFKLVDYIKSNQDKFYRVAYSYTKSKEDALDIVQESVYKGLKSVHILKNKNYMATWFYRILINTSITYYKKGSQIDLRPVVDEEGYVSPYQSAEYVDLYNAIDGLSAVDRGIIILRYFEDQKIKDIAEIMGMNENTLKTRLYKILGQLREDLACEVIDDDY
jgi:RNA polymerase sigma-70 factor (ECF subfamily)